MQTEIAGQSPVNSNGTYGTTINDYPNTTYWWAVADCNAEYRPFTDNPNRHYLVDVNNPYNGDSHIGAWPHRATKPFGYFRNLVRSQGNQVVDVTDPNITLHVITINKITDRDYVLTIQGGNFRAWQYVVRDCNHYNHAFNRFRKRVRENINPMLDVNLSVVDDRPQEVPSEWPQHVAGLTEDQRMQVYKWAGENQFQFAASCNCDVCQKTYTKFVNRPKDGEVTVKVADVVQTIENIVNIAQEQAVQDTPTYDLFLSVNFESAVGVSGSSDLLSLIRQGQRIVRSFENATPNAEAQIRDGRGNIQVSITSEGVQVY